MTTSTVVERPDRAQIAERYRWNLADLYPTEPAWRSAKARVADDLRRLDAFHGRLTSSAVTLAEALDMRSAFDKELSRLYVYASMLADEDTRSSHPEGMRQEMVQLAAAF